MLRLNNIVHQAVLLKKLLPPPAIVVPVATKMKANKHWNPKYKRFRTLKVVKIKLPDFYDGSEDVERMTPDEIRAKMKERGVLPPRIWNERNFTLSCTAAPFEPYVPPEGDGKLSLISLGGAKQVAQRIDKKRTSWLTVRKVRSYDEDFDPIVFAAEEAQELYKNLHKAMTEIPVDEDKINTLATEKAYAEVMDNLKHRVIKWDFIESIEPPRVVHGRHTHLITKDNIFAQLTVRFHSKQVLAIYDRFGRICHGNPVVAKDVLEYVVFEKHLADTYGSWRIHHKIVPDWMQVPPQDRRTLRLTPEEPEPEKPAAIDESLPSATETTSLPPSTPGNQPQVAAA